MLLIDVYKRQPYDIKKEFGKGRVKVRATFDGIVYDGSIVNMGIKNDDGSVCYIIGAVSYTHLDVYKRQVSKLYFISSLTKKFIYYVFFL